MSEIAGRYFMHNDQLMEVDQFSEFYKTNGISVYEVIRVIDGKPLFYSDHLERLKKSAQLAKCKLFLSDVEILNQTNELMEANNFLNGNIKIVFNYPPAEARIPGIFQAFFLKTRYPELSLYKNGIKTKTLSIVRSNPNAKVFNHSVRSVTSKMIDQHTYEVLLANEQDLLTEGSMSNLFFIKDDRVYTAPLYLVLPGITRKYVLECCRKQQLTVIEQAVSIDDLELYDAAFISGTSPKVLPICKIDHHQYDVKNSVLEKVMNGYNQLLASNLESC